MKKISGYLLLAMVLSIFLSAYTDAGSETQEPRLITVTGDAAVKVVPDEVAMTLGVETWHRELSVAKKRNDQHVSRVIAVAKRYGIQSKHIQTDFISIDPHYSDDYWRDELEGYFIRKTVVITLKDISKFDDLLTDVIEEGVNYIHGIDFRTTELRKYRDQARALAINAAQEKATALAQELGQEVGVPQMIREDQTGWWSWYGAGWWGYRYGSMSQNVVQNAGGDFSGFEGSIAPGQISVTARVTVTFVLD